MISESKQLDDQQRQRIEISLANYNIPFQILEKIADKCGCKIDARSFLTRGSGERANRFSCLNNETIHLLLALAIPVPAIALVLAAAHMSDGIDEAAVDEA